MTTDDELIACIQAKKAGKVIEKELIWPNAGNVPRLIMAKDEPWDTSRFRYYIKPEVEALLKAGGIEV